MTRRKRRERNFTSEVIPETQKKARTDYPPSAPSPPLPSPLPFLSNAMLSYAGGGISNTAVWGNGSGGKSRALLLVRRCTHRVKSSLEPLVSGGRWRCESCVVGVCGAVVVRVGVEESGSGGGKECEGDSVEGERDPGVGGKERCVRLVVVLCTAMAGEVMFA